MQFILGLREFGHRAIGSLLALVVMAALALPAISPSAMAAPQFAALTVDARTGKLIFSSDADGQRGNPDSAVVKTAESDFQAAADRAEQIFSGNFDLRQTHFGSLRSPLSHFVFNGRNR